MADIFGREMHDYQHMMDLQRMGLLAQAQSEWTRTRGAPAHNFQALEQFSAGLGQMHVRAEENAQAVGFMTNNLQAIMSMVEEILYTRERLTEHVPVITNVPEGADTYSYRVVDHVGRGRFIEFDGTSAPTATAGQFLVPYALRYAGIIAQWTMEDFRRARMAGMALDTESLEAATTGAMNHIEEVAFVGDDQRGMKGLTNLPVPTIDQEPTGSQVRLVSATDRVQDLTADEMVVFLQEHTTDVIERTKEVFGRTLTGELCIYMPIGAAAAVNETRLPDTDKNVWQYFAANNSWMGYTSRPPMLKWLAELESAGTVAAGNNNRYIWALKDPRVMEMAVPIMPRILTIQDTGFAICAPMEYKISPLNVKRPSTITYVDPS